ncbi:DNA cytosine methyltransferase [Mycobacterium sp. IS-1496]|uniref:DNA cytosine methyltransferase n=1 Tax=Mycobacterium sp. IS-1496 TaxID=1772284 RepID=UPI0009E9590C|nr:DNA cytosine methyltransferase [Mycobacterium sp. IS-1496]
MNLSVVDLFSGCGGLSAGFREAGFSIVAGAEILPKPLEVFAENFPDAVAIGEDLRRVEPIWLRERLKMAPGQLDVLIGGPPCQGWSKNTPASKRRLDDERNSLMLRYLDFARAFMPKALLIENVAETIKAYESSASELMIEQLENLGYTANLCREIATDYGVPQRRRRAIIVASLGGLPPMPRIGLPAKADGAETTVWEAISDLPPLAIGEESNTYAAAPENAYQKWCREGSPPLTAHFARKLTENQMRRVRHLPPGSGAALKDLPADVRPKMGYSGAYGRLWADQPARTITKWVFHPGSGRFLHPYDDRVITIREAARLQGFPDWFKFSGTYIQQAHMVGEAVPPLMAYAWALGFREALTEKAIA